MSTSSRHSPYVIKELAPHGRILWGESTSYYLNPHGVLYRVRDAILLADERFQWVPFGDERATVRVFKGLQTMPVYHVRQPGVDFALTAERCFAQMDQVKTRYGDGQRGSFTPPSKAVGETRGG